MVLKKSLTLYERDEKGKLIAKEVTLNLAKDDKTKYPELKKETVKIVPLTRGELKKMFGLSGKDDDEKPDTDKDTDAELIVSNCYDPLYTLEELTFAKPVIVRSIVRTIFIESGVQMDDGEGKKSIIDKDEFAKN